MKPANTFCGKTRRDFLNTVGGADIIKEIIA
jgi:hypothetical protein